MSRVYQPTGLDKQSRLYAQTAKFENGQVFLPRQAPWLAEYVQELTSYPGSKYDDQVDSTTQALERAEMHGPGDNILEFYELKDRLAEQERQGTQAIIRVQFPKDFVGSITTSKNRTFHKSDSDVFEVTEEEAIYLCFEGFTKV